MIYFIFYAKSFYFRYYLKKNTKISEYEVNSHVTHLRRITRSGRKVVGERDSNSEDTRETHFRRITVTSIVQRFARVIRVHIHTHAYIYHTKVVTVYVG